MLKGVGCRGSAHASRPEPVTSHPVLYVCNVAKRTPRRQRGTPRPSKDGRGARCAHLIISRRSRPRSHSFLRRRDSVSRLHELDEPGFDKLHRAPATASRPDHPTPPPSEGTYARPSTRAPRRRRRPASSTPTSSAGPSAPRRSPTQISSRSAAKWPPRGRQGARRGKDTSSRTATSCFKFNT